MSGLLLGPRAVERPTDGGWTMVATLDGAGVARVDGGGLVTVDGASWSLDWWIGADDRWYLPAREATVRQRRVGPGPVIETTVRIPSGDARHVAYSALIGSTPATIVEITNDSPVPVALAMAIRPYAVDDWPINGSSSSLARPGGDALRVLHVDDEVVRFGTGPRLLLPRRPSGSGGSATSDLLSQVLEGQDLTWEEATEIVGNASSPATESLHPNSVLLYPLPHRTSLRFAIVAGAEAEGRVAEHGGSIDVSAAPDAEMVDRGWASVVSSGARYDVAEPGLAQLAGVAQSRIRLAVRGFDADFAPLEPGTGRLLAAAAVAGLHDEVAKAATAIVEAYPQRAPSGLSADDAAVAGSELIAALAFVGSVGMAEPADLLETAVHLAYLVDRRSGRRRGLFARRGRSVDPGAVPRSVEVAVGSLAKLARLAGDDAGADAALADLGRSASGGQHSEAGEVGLLAAFGSATTNVDRIEELAAAARPAGSWGDDDPLVAADLLLELRRLVVDDRKPDELRLLPVFPSSWRGGGVEIHRAPTDHGLLSFAIRWHGARPALLWELDSGSRPRSRRPAITCPSLDPSWSTTDRRGETLLAGVSDGLAPAPMPGDSFS